MVGSTEIAVELFEAKLMKWRQPASDTGTTSIQTQFEVCRPLLYYMLIVERSSHSLCKLPTQHFTSVL